MSDDDTLFLELPRDSLCMLAVGKAVDPFGAVDAGLVVDTGRASNAQVWDGLR